MAGGRTSLGRYHARGSVCDRDGGGVGECDFSRFEAANDLHASVDEGNRPGEGIPAFQADTYRREDLNAEGFEKEADRGETGQGAAFATCCISEKS